MSQRLSNSGAGLIALRIGIEQMERDDNKSRTTVKL
jgi:hypothetical protein